MSNQLIQPRTLKGFRDFLPEMMLPREALIEVCKRVYRSYGFAPIDTPTLELFEILTGKGSEETDRQMYHFVDQGERHVGMRFDLTVPLARFVAQHSAQLGMPFKRYHIATVWRGEAPQAGRYREFMQCDFDTIGTTSLTSDIETGLVIIDLMKALGFERFEVRINNRKVLNGFLEKFGLAERATAVLRAIDKLPKVGPKAIETELSEVAKLNLEQTAAVIEMAQLAGEPQLILSQMADLISGNPLGEQGCEELRAMFAAFDELGVGKHVRIDPSIARGLDYYTGTIFETFLLDKPEIGSVCSGGRYDNLAGLFTREQLPGIGASLGLDRLLAAMEMLGMLPAAKTPAQIMIANFRNEDLAHYLRLAALLRQAGFNVEVYPDSKKLGAQFKFADRRGFQGVIVAGPDELQSQQVQLKWLADSSQTLVSIANSGENLINELNAKLNRSGTEVKM
ncbi:MAG: histidine--tRNA ligase [Pirellulaceae bacterium]|nr:histidine--tRNA ligase [Pirellulaceae bacterium]